MKISVITVARNAQDTIDHTIASVAAQDHGCFEHIIVEGASTDATMKIVKAAAHHRLRWISEPDRGLYDAMNKGLALASGDLIGFLNADDFFCRRDALSLLAAAALSNPRADAFGGAVAIVKQDSPSAVHRFYRSAGFRPWMLRFGHMPPHPGFYVRRRAAESVGDFDHALSVGADFEWMLRFFHVNQLCMAALPQTLVGLRMGGVSTRGLASWRTINAEALRSCQQWGIATNSVLIWSKYLAKSAQLLRRPPDFPLPPPLGWLPRSV